MKWSFRQAKDNVVKFPNKTNSKKNELLEECLKIPRPAGLPDSEHLAAVARKEVRRRLKEFHSQD